MTEFTPARLAELKAVAEAASEPCKCHRNFAYIIPTHSGHCCFFPETQTCHEAEVASWVQENEARRK